MFAEIQITRKKVRHARIVISPDCRIALTVPVNFSQKNIDYVLRSREDWIRRTLARFEKNKQYLVSLAPGEMFYRGEVFRLVHDRALGERVLILEEEKVLRSGLSLDKPEPQEAFYQAEARRILVPRLRELAERYGLDLKRVFIRSQKTKWGTCSSLGNISLNWRLIKAPAAVADYVMLHELAHLKHLNHSEEYWRELERMCPDYAVHRDWLKKYGRNY